MNATVNGISVHYTLEGPASGPVVTMSNSLASNLSMWDPQLPVLTSRYQVLRYDTRGHGGTEAPTVVKSLSSGTWWLWGDTYTPNGVFYAWQSSSLASGTWTALDQKTYTQPVNSKHCGIATITTAEYNNLLTKWGAPAWNRLKSYNYPARYVRHSDYAGRIDEYPVEPYKDSLWTLVPGLADSSGVSFRSVNYPDRYLRHYNYALRLDVNDGTSTFAGDATFYRTAGLADASWASFRSYNNPTRYIRHSNYVLRIDPVSTTTEKQDATFRVGF